MSTPSNRILAALLLFMVAGAGLICLYTSVPSMGGHEGEDMPTEQNTARSHIFHANELALATVVSAPFALTILFLAVFIVVLGISRKSNISSAFALLIYLRRKRQDILFVTQTAIRDWLSLIERNPDLLFAPA